MELLCDGGGGGGEERRGVSFRRSDSRGLIANNVVLTIHLISIGLRNVFVIRSCFIGQSASDIYIHTTTSVFLRSAHTALKPCTVFPRARLHHHNGNDLLTQHELHHHRALTRNSHPDLQLKLQHPQRNAPSCKSCSPLDVKIQCRDSWILPILRVESKPRNGTWRQVSSTNGTSPPVEESLRSFALCRSL